MSSKFESIMTSKKALIIAIVAFAAAVLILILPAKESGASGENRDLEAIEKQTAAMLERLDGISDISVMISLKEPETKKSAYSGYAKEGSDDTLKSLYSDISGIAVICRGGGDPLNQKKIITFLSSLFGIPTNRIFVGE